MNVSIETSKSKLPVQAMLYSILGAAGILYILDLMLLQKTFSTAFAVQSLLLFMGSAAIIFFIEYLVARILLMMPVSPSFRVLTFGGVVLIGLLPFLRGYFARVSNVHQIWGILGLPVAMIAVLLMAIVGGFMVLRVAKGGKISAFLFLGGAIVILWADQQLLQSLYLPLHWMLVISGLVGIQLFLFAMLPKNRKNPKRCFIPAGVLVVALSVPYLTFLRTNHDRRLALMYTSYLKPLVQMHRALVDLDRDGHAFILGGGDTNDFNPKVVYLHGKALSVKKLATYPYGKSSLTVPGQGTPIIIITFDALSRQELLKAGPGWPHMKALYNGGTRFSNAYSPGSTTRVSFPILFSGCYDPRKKGCATLAHILKNRGYSTAAVVTDNIPGMIRTYSSHWKLDPFSPFFGGLDFLSDFEEKIVVHPKSGELPADAVSRAAIKKLRKLNGRPFLLWVHFFETHDWFTWSGRTWADAWTHPVESYDAVLHRLDPAVGRLTDFLKKSGLMDRSIIVMTGDHGEALGYRGFRTHSIWVYNCLVHVPLSIRIPGVDQGVSNMPVGLVDLHRTILSVLGIHDGWKDDGCDIRPLFSNGKKNGSRPLFFTARRQVGLLEYPYKLSFNFKQNILGLYNLQRDPMEEHDLSDKFPSMFHTLMHTMIGFLGHWFPGAIK